MKDLNELEKAYADLGKEIEALKNVKSEWPQEDDEYWFINDEGEFVSESWENASFDIDKQKVHNLFKTESGAKKRQDYLQCLFDLKSYADEVNEGWKADWSAKDHKYSLSFSREGLPVEVSTNLRWGQVTFKSEELAKQAISHIGEERLKAMLTYLSE